MLKLFYFIFIIILCFNLPIQITGCKTNEQKQEQVSIGSNQSRDILQLEKAISLKGVKGRIDHMSMDIKDQLLFIAALGNNSVEIADLKKAERTNSIKGINEPQGILYINDNNSICITSGESGDLDFYDANALALEKSIHLGTDADNLRYDSESKLIYAGYGVGNIAIIDALKQSLISTVSFSGHPEAFQFDKSRNLLYVNVPKTNSIEVISSKTDSVVDDWKINNSASNFPIALDESQHLLFIGCRKPAKIVVFDTDLQKEIANFVIKKDVDDIFYDSVRKLIYLSCGEGYFQIFKQTDRNAYELVQEINTSVGARTSLFVPELNRIFVAAPENNNNDAAILVFKF